MNYEPNPGEVQRENNEPVTPELTIKKNALHHKMQMKVSESFWKRNNKRIIEEKRIIKGKFYVIKNEDDDWEEVEEAEELNFTNKYF